MWLCSLPCRSEAAALLDKPGCTAEQAALELGPHCMLVSVTDGANGSYLSALGQLLVVPPVWMPDAPVDTNGAGDAYAAGMLYGFLCGYDPVSMGRAGARVAAAVISKQGAALGSSQAAELATLLPDAARANPVQAGVRLSSHSILSSQQQQQVIS